MLPDFVSKAYKQGKDILLTALLIGVAIGIGSLAFEGKTDPDSDCDPDAD
jgi:hypothetical protein